jgi:phosphoadenosine phosphosulfate reductase family protein
MSYRSKSLSKLLKQIDDEYKNSFLPVVLPHNCLDALLAVKPDLRYWRGQGEHCLVCASPPLPIKQDPSGRPDRLGMVNGRLKTTRTLPLEEKIALAYRVLDRMFEVTDAVAVAFSGGRDSLVALHLTLQRRRDVKVVFVNTSIEFPETLQYVRALAQDWGFEFHEVNAEKNFWELSRERGLPIGGRGNQFFLAELSEASGVKLSNACCNQLKITPARQFYREAGIDAQVTGLRVDESMMRRFNFADYGGYATVEIMTRL